MRCSVLLSCCHSPTTKAVLLLLTCQFIILCIFIQLNLRTASTQLSNANIQLITPTETINKTKDKKSQQQHQVVKEPSQTALVHAIEATNKTSQQRVKHIRAYCNEHKEAILSQNPDYGRTGRRLTNWIWMISNHHNLFYCATPKCGSTTWKSYLMEDLRIDWKVDTHE